MDRILRATAAIGLSTILTVGFGALRYKFIAVEIGADGVGLLGILLAAVAFGVIFFSAGLPTSGVQATAAAEDDRPVFERARAALIIGSRWLAAVGGAAITVVALTIGRPLLPSSMGPTLAVWLGLALAATVVSGAQVALLNGVGRIRALATSNALGSAVGTVATITAVYVSEPAGIIAALAATPFATLIFTSWSLRRDRKHYPHLRFSEWWPEFRGMFLLGGVIMLGMLLGSATQLFIRLWLQHTGGLEDAGYFQAAWSITSVYLGFVLGALAVEYYPRICKQINELGRLNTSVDRQIRVALLLGTPVLLWMIVASPLVLHILYVPSFQIATELVRWQLFGDILKIAGWAVAFLLLARKSRVAFFVTELSWNICYLAIAIPLATLGGFKTLGIAYAVSYAFYTLVTLLLAYKETRFLLNRLTTAMLLTILLVGGATLWGSESDSMAGTAISIALASVMTVASVISIVLWRARDRKDSLVEEPLA